MVFFYKEGQGSGDNGFSPGNADTWSMVPTGGGWCCRRLGLGYCGTVLCYVPYRTCATGRHWHITRIHIAYSIRGNHFNSSF